MQPQFITLPQRANDLSDQRFGRLVAIGPVGYSPAKDTVWFCQCECGKTLTARSVDLRHGRKKSCGCLRLDELVKRTQTHGMSKTHLYRTWAGMIRRCTNPDAKAYANYGGRGINVCPEWRTSFEAFRDHVSQLPHCDDKGYSLDRIDNFRDYMPHNVRWASKVEQAQNTRANIMLTYDGKTQCVATWATEMSIHPQTLTNRVRKGWDAEKALTTPVGPNHNPGSRHRKT